MSKEVFKNYNWQNTYSGLKMVSKNNIMLSFGGSKILNKLCNIYGKNYI